MAVLSTANWDHRRRNNKAKTAADEKSDDLAVLEFLLIAEHNSHSQAWRPNQQILLLRSGCSHHVNVGIGCLASIDHASPVSRIIPHLYPIDWASKF